MIINLISLKHLVFSLAFFIFIQTGSGQTVLSEEDYNKTYDNKVKIENSEVNDGASHLHQFKTLDKSHMFFETPEFLEGHIKYKDQVYKTELKYNISNDLILVKDIDNNESFPLDLNTSLVDNFKIDERTFVRLDASEELDFMSKNGFFEEAFKGKNIIFYIKHKKKLKKKSSRSQDLYFFIEEEIYLFKYKNHFYKIKNKRNIAKVIPHLKKDIYDFFGHLRSVNALSLKRLFAKIDKKAFNENQED